MKKLGLVIAMALVAATAVQADILAGWDVTGLAANTMSVAADAGATHADMSAGDLVSGPRMAGPSWPDAIGTFAESWRMGPDIWNSVALGSYWGFTLTPDAGKTASYDSIDAQLAVNCAGTTDVTFHLLASSDGGATGFAGGDVLDAINITDNVVDYAPTYYQVSFDLSGAGLTGLSTATEFRIHVSSVSGNRVGIGHTFGAEIVTDELVVNGSVIPEPATMGLFGLVGGGLLWFRKRFA